MAKKPTETEVANTADTETTETTALALSGGDPTGLAFDANDITIPRLNVIQKTSEIEGDLGSIMLDKMFELAPAGKELLVYVARADKAFKENIPYDEDKVPQIVSNPDEVAALAEESEYEIIEFADITLLIPAPEGREDDEEAFPLPIGDKQYALGKMTVQKDSYRNTFKRLATFAAFHPKLSVQDRLWRFKSDEISRGKYTWFTPALAVSPDTASIDEDAVAFVKQLAAM